GRVAGIADWGLARGDAPAAFDLCHLALTTRMLVSGKEIGEVVCDLLRDPRWNADEQRCFAGQSLASSESEIRMLVLLAWLHRVAGSGAGWARYVGECLATASKIERILHAIDGRP